jgi:arylsulfatase A-like enzyme
MKRNVLLGVLTTVVGLGSIAVAAETPNVVLIISDDQAWGDFGFMGHDVIQTPRIDRLASESLVFTRGYVPSSLCRPSLAMLATGLYPHQHKITSNDPPRELPKEEFLSQRFQQISYIDRVPTLPRMLATREYLSLQTGKWWEGHHSRGGFTHGMTHGDTTRGGRHGDEGLKIGREGMQPIFDFIEARGDQPFFIWHAPFLPHSPHNPPQRLLDKYVGKTDSLHVAKYWAMCEWFDETCGQLLDYLDEKELADDTLVLFVVDNGWIQSADSRRYAPRSKQSQYDGGLRTPIMLRWPGRIEPRRDEKTPVLSIDLVPTILAATGLAPTAEMPGINLLDAPALAARDTIFGEIFAHNAVDIHDPASSLRYRWCIQGGWKLVLPNAPNVPDGEVELYNVLADPYEKNNTAQADPDRVAQLRKLINNWWPAK